MPGGPSLDHRLPAFTGTRHIFVCWLQARWMPGWRQLQRAVGRAQAATLAKPPGAATTAGQLQAMCGLYGRKLRGLWVRGCTGESHHLIVVATALLMSFKVVPLMSKVYVFADELYEP